MQAIYRCGHTKEFNDERFHDAQIGHIMNSYAVTDCPTCRQLGPAKSPDDAHKLQGSEKIARQNKPLTPLEERLVAGLNEPFGPAEEDDIFADRTSPPSAP